MKSISVTRTQYLLELAFQIHACQQVVEHFVIILFFISNLLDGVGYNAFPENSRDVLYLWTFTCFIFIVIITHRWYDKRFFPKRTRKGSHHRTENPQLEISWVSNTIVEMGVVTGERLREFVVNHSFLICFMFSNLQCLDWVRLVLEIRIHAFVIETSNPVVEQFWDLGHPNEHSFPIAFKFCLVVPSKKVINIHDFEFNVQLVDSLPLIIDASDNVWCDIFVVPCLVRVKIKNSNRWCGSCSAFGVFDVGIYILVRYCGSCKTHFVVTQ